MRSKFFGFLKFAGVCAFLFVVSFLAGTRILCADPTLLHLDFQDGQGGKVHVSHAKLVLVVDNYVDKKYLPIGEDGGVDIPLDASWLRANWPGGKNRIKNLERVYIFLKAPGYAAVCSDPIHWMGTESDGMEKNVVITFPRGKTAAISKGDKFSMVVNFRKPVDRSVKVSDGKGHPLPGVLVKSFVYWSKTDKGELNGADFLGVGTSDADGKMPVIDGDFTYALQVTRPEVDGKASGTILVVKKFGDKDQEAPVAVPTDGPTVIDMQKTQ